MINYFCSYQYDFNGNIVSLQRKDETTQIMHNINYTYPAISNRLNSITATGINSSSYIYDAIGNLKQDIGEGLVITWNATSKVKQVIKNGQLMMNLGYSATGQRQVKATNSATEYYFGFNGHEILDKYNEKQNTQETIDN